MSWPRRFLCWWNGGHRPKIWASEWKYDPDTGMHSRILEARCRDCQTQTSSWIEDDWESRK